jgi:ACS family glucarate transporter-like MFS transporter
MESNLRPSRARQVVLFFAVTLAVITYIDRVCISQAAPMMQEELGLTKTQMGYAFRSVWLGLCAV